MTPAAAAALLRRRGGATSTRASPWRRSVWRRTTARAGWRPCAPALTRDEAIRRPQIAAAGGLVEYDRPTAGRLRQARPAARFAAAPAGPPRPAPELGADTDAVLLELGLPDSEIAALRADGVIGGGEGLTHDA